MRWETAPDNRIRSAEVDKLVRDMAFVTIKQKEPVFSDRTLLSILVEDLTYPLIPKLICRLAIL